MAPSAAASKPAKRANSKRGSRTRLTDVPDGATLAVQAYHAIRDRIITLDLPPGGLIREEELMSDLGMSRTPVREALLRLSLERLVVMVSRRGTFVSDVNIGEVGRIYELRRGLEAQATEWAAKRRRESDMAEIDAILDELRQIPSHPAQTSTDARSQVPLDQRAHFLIYRLAGNHFAEEVLKSHYLLSSRMWFLAAGHVTMDEPFDLMIEMFEAIKAGDAKTARRLAIEHSEHAERSLREAL